MKALHISHILMAAMISMWTYQLVPTNVIFDLGGVLLKPNKSAIALHAGPFNLAWYAISHMENPRVGFFNILQEIIPFTDTAIQPCDDTGMPLPGIMCDWLKGIPTKKIRAKLAQRIPITHPLSGLAYSIFEPQFMANSQRIIDEGKLFVQECIEHGHCVYILSNWDAESFTYLLFKYPDFFGLFSGILISGDCGLLKPDPEIFRHLMIEYKLDPATCFFVDNQPENVHSASRVGIAGTIVMEHRSTPDFSQVRTDLYRWLDSRTQPTIQQITA